MESSDKPLVSSRVDETAWPGTSAARVGQRVHSIDARQLRLATRRSNARRMTLPLCIRPSIAMRSPTALCTIWVLFRIINLHERPPHATRRFLHPLHAAFAHATPRVHGHALNEPIVCHR